MKKQALLFLACICCISAVQAQFLRKMKDRVRSLTAVRTDSSLTEGPFETPANGPVNGQPSLTISGSGQLQLDSVFEFDIAVYQETEAWQGNQRVVKGGEEIIVFYSSARPQLAVHLVSKSTGARYQFYADFRQGAQLSITAIHNIGSGTREKLDLHSMEPVYPGETGYLNRLIKTGEKKVIAGVACEEYKADNIRRDSTIGGTSHALATASVWTPMQPHTLFPGYALIPEEYKDEMERMLVAGSYPPVAMPLEMHLEYSNGDRVDTYTTDIVKNENRRVRVAAVIE
ncbi:hypothetical protein [Chitinophaga solisilvae]|uniref:hypothetical protein n=1 Tax=Chitinophaga solisilvae TaxID=1233460 RepID=UPI00136D5AC3|nr:hypothetical protein [Chitinophaga solisilvae]